MKKSYAFILICLLPTASVFSQKKLKEIKGDYIKPTTDKEIKPLTKGAFDRFVTDNFSYTILGNQSPSTGLKVETATPSISLKGTLYKNLENTFFTTLELQAGAEGNLFKVFSSDELNSQFKATLGFYYLPGKNNASYHNENQNILKHWRTRAILKYEELVLQEKKTKVMEALLDSGFQNSIGKDEVALRNQLGADSEITDSELEKLARECMESFSVKEDHKNFDEMLKEFATNWIDFDQMPEEKAKFLTAYKENLAIQKKGVDSIHNYEIRQVQKVWTRKYLWWLNATPFVANTNYRYFQPTPATLENESSLLFGTKIAVNFYWKFAEAHRYVYATIGIAPQKMNSLDEMTKYSYKKTVAKTVTDPANPDQKEVISDEETGTAYEGVFRSGFGIEYFAEAFLVLWKNAYAPGFYGKLGYSHTEHRLNQNRSSAYLGLVWNVTNRDKDSKNLLTIIPYAGWTNFNKQYTDETKSKVKPLHSLFTAGLQVGIPINIGK